MARQLAADSSDPRRPLRTPAALAPFVAAGVLVSADVHVARRLTALAGERDELVMLALALAVRAPRLGHVHVDLRRIRQTAAVEAEEPLDLGELPWPEPSVWLEHLRPSPLLKQRGDGVAAPLQLEGERLYLERYWRLECSLAHDIAAASRPVEEVSLEALADGLERLFAAERGERQAQAAATAVLQRFCVVAGGPGTGKTTTVARIVALLHEQAAALGARSPLIALAAPTGRAAARLQQTLHEATPTLAVSAAVHERMLSLSACTIHRLLGSRPENRSRFRHHRGQRLPHDAVIVDESSMVSLALMARLLEAIRPAARIVLVGDPGQLASIEAGAVLGDIAGPAALEPRLSRRAARRLGSVVGGRLSYPPSAAGAVPADGVIALERVHRFGAGIAALADAIRGGDPDRALALLRDPPPELGWLALEAGDPDGAERLDPLRTAVVQFGGAAVVLARDGDGAGALAALSRFRLLCAHRRGPHGVLAWTARIERWLSAEVERSVGERRWYAGRPLLVTENDYELGLFNGDLGVVVTDPGSGEPIAVFELRGVLARLRPVRLGAVQSAHVITIHKSQGSQFDQVAVVLPDPASPLLTRELLYTAVTRARRRVLLIGGEDSVRRAIERPVARASGLRERLWGAAGDQVADSAAASDEGAGAAAGETQ
jgi:exodeoxyribonuclease V alpha subunit